MSPGWPTGDPRGPPVALYVHVPWCLRKCPYCDFNSHALRGELPAKAYVDRLLQDLDQELQRLPPRRALVSVFLGGGTPSLLPGTAVARLLSGVRDRLTLEPDAEITLEANPGAADARRFAGYREAGVNRLSLGAQSMSAQQLRHLTRIHGPDEVRESVRLAREAGFDNLNLDLMYGLPRQGLAQAGADLQEALELAPEHLSYYQLTLEPNTAFHATPPPLPDHDLTADLHQQGAELLDEQGYRRYEVSAYARPGRRCRHNLNYWTFGDYLGIGAGAHGKRSDPASGAVERTVRVRHPAAYLAGANRSRTVASTRRLAPQDLVLEFAMNALRLTEGFAPVLFERRTGLALGDIVPQIESARARGLLEHNGTRLRPTELGSRFLDDLVGLFAGWAPRQGPAKRNDPSA